MRKNERTFILVKPSENEKASVSKQDNADEAIQEPKQLAESHLYNQQNKSAVPKNAGESKSVVKFKSTQKAYDIHSW